MKSIFIASQFDMANPSKNPQVVGHYSSVEKTRTLLLERYPEHKEIPDTDYPLAFGNSTLSEIIIVNETKLDV